MRGLLRNVLQVKASSGARAALRADGRVAPGSVVVAVDGAVEQSRGRAVAGGRPRGLRGRADG